MRRNWQRHDERGLAIIYLALVLTVLMIMAALVVDIGNARQQRANAQAAVDSAALSGAQVLDTKATAQAWQVFDLAANTALETIVPATWTKFSSGSLGAETNCTPLPAGSGSTPPAVCKEYVVNSDGTHGTPPSGSYDVQVTTPFIGPGESTPDPTLLNMKACWNVPTTFGRVVGTNFLHLCATATAQNGVGQGGPSNGGCGSTNELTNISSIGDAMGAPGSQKISAEYKAGTNGSALDRGPVVGGVNTQGDIHFVVQTQYGNFIQLAKGAYTLTDKSGNWTDVVISYTLPATINAASDNDGDDRYSPGSKNYVSDGDNDDTAAYSHTFSANLQVIDGLGQNCGSASWSTCNPQGHDPIFDGGNSGDTGGANWGVGWPAGSNSNGVSDDDIGNGGDNDGHDLNATADQDDTVMPGLGTLVTAGTPVGAIYNDEQPLRAASVSFVIDGVPLAESANFANGTFSFVDPSTVWSTNLATKPTRLTQPVYGVVTRAFPATVNTQGVALPKNTIELVMQDNMYNPMPGEKITSITSNPVGWAPALPAVATGLDGATAPILLPAKPTGVVTYTVNYSPDLANNAVASMGPGSFSFTANWNASTMGTVSNESAYWQASNGFPDMWGTVTAADANTQGTDQSSMPYGGSVGIMYNSGGNTLVNGWHSAVLFANDGDVTSGGGDCSIITWAFASTGGAPGPGTLHLIT